MHLTALTHGGGCACKLSADELAEALSPFMSHAAFSHPSLLVGVGTSDDAGVWVLGADLALVQTVDFFTPIVDDPYDWGRVAAANALSDVYAMGGWPVTALQMIGWPRSELGSGAIRSVVAGGADAMVEAGCTIVGGHSIDSPEPTYGFAVTGVARPDEVVSNAGALPSDRLVLTKPLGVGIITAAVKSGSASREATESAVVTMTTLNAVASSAMRQAGAHAATDVTGFGLLGHLREMIAASGVGALIDMSAVPVLAGAVELAEAGVYSGGSRRNLHSAEAYTDFGDASPAMRRVLADAQTSGGLLIAIARERGDELLRLLNEGGSLAAAVIGEVTPGPPQIAVRP